MLPWFPGTKATPLSPLHIFSRLCPFTQHHKTRSMNEGKLIHWTHVSPRHITHSSYSQSKSFMQRRWPASTSPQPIEALRRPNRLLCSRTHLNVWNNEEKETLIWMCNEEIRNKLWNPIFFGVIEEIYDMRRFRGIRIKFHTDTFKYSSTIKAIV
jgi:hypothetical protein